MLNEPAEDTLTATQVAKTFNMSTLDFNAVLRDIGIQYRSGGRWNLSDDLEGLSCSIIFDMVEGTSSPVTLGALMWAVITIWQPHSMPARKVIISQFSISGHVFCVWA